MLNKPIKVNLNGKDIVIVGTAHVSKESVELVKKTIDNENPDAVAVELCQQRYEALVDRRRWDETEIHKVLREGKVYLFLMQLLMTNFQRKIGDDLGITPGSEMIKAIEDAKARGIGVILVDRDIKVTLRRAFNEMSLIEKSKLASCFISGMSEGGEIDERLIEELKEKDVLTEMMEELGKEIPSAKRVLVDERDMYIANKIAKIEGKKIVAVVGAGHVEGIRNLLKSGRYKRADIKKLEHIPEKRNLWRFVGYVVPALIVLVVAAGFLLKGEAFVMESVWKWILINGGLSALGVILALGHPLSVITAFVAAPLTSLNPMLAAGWFAGLTEAKMRKPKVKDFEGLLRLNSIRDYWRNRVTRILLVVAFANIGSALGTWIAGFSIFAGIYNDIASLLPL